MYMPLGSGAVIVPKSKPEAVKMGIPFYEAATCEVCAALGRGHIDDSAARYVKTDRCVRCSIGLAIGALFIVQGSHKLVEGGVCSNSGNDDIRITPTQYLEIQHAVKGDIALGRSYSQELGYDYYMNAYAARNCGHIGKHFTRTRKCVACFESKVLSPRQAAIRAGERTYMPLEPCVHCGTLSGRSVHSGTCSGCKVQAPRDTSTADMMAAVPDMVLSRSDAQAAGLTVYRTGEKCHKGHRGYRYVSTGNCLDCL